MNESILTTIKKLLGIEEYYEAFDTDVMIHINSVFMTLNQLGVGPDEGFSISGKYETWEQFTENIKLYNGVKTYIYLKVKLVFDPPSSSFVLESMRKEIAELEWRLVHQTELPQTPDEESISFEEIDDLFE